MARSKKRSIGDRVRFWLIAAAIAGLTIVALTSEPRNTDQPTVVSETFRLCTSPPHLNCVIDGDTFYLEDQSVRIADIDAPEIGTPECAQEAQLGLEATIRMLELLNAGNFELTLYDNRNVDQYGRLLRVVSARGVSLGGVLVAEGLAREWDGPNVDWCG